MCRVYRKSPSELLRIDDDYTAYCLNEAIVEFILMLDKGKKPLYMKRSEDEKRKNTGLQMLIGKK